MTMPDDIRQWRKGQRNQLLARRVSAAEDQRRAWNQAITAALLEGFPLLQQAVIGFYWPFKGEFDPRFAIHGLRKGGARAALPEVVQKNAPLRFREWWPGVGTTKGVFDLPVPTGTEVLVPQALLIPPIGFDARGYRLGYGGGYFDRTLAALTPQPIKIGVAYELSRIASIQPQAHDIPMDFIVTEAGIHVVGDKGLEAVGDRAQLQALVRAIAAQRNWTPGTAGREAGARDARFAADSSFALCYARPAQSTD